jgi:hypothetical protein
LANFSIAVAIIFVNASLVRISVHKYIANMKTDEQIRSYIYDLVSRFSDPAGTLRDPNKAQWMGVPTPSETALEEAERVNDLRFFPPLKEICNQRTGVSDKFDKIESKKYAYHILSYLYSNTRNFPLLEYMINRLTVEKNLGLIETMLGTLGSNANFLKSGISEEISIAPILALLTHKNARIRHCVIRCLENTHTPVAEDALINVISTSSDKEMLLAACATLQVIGTERSIDCVKKLIEAQEDRVEEGVIRTLVHLSGKSGLHTYVLLLKNNRYKREALDAVIKFGDCTSVPYVENRVKQLLSRKRAKKIAIYGNDKTDFTQAIGFLSAYVTEYPSINKLYNSILSHKLEMLFAEEKKWMSENKEKFN